MSSIKVEKEILFNCGKFNLKDVSLPGGEILVSSTVFSHLPNNESVQN
jgi:hypothetical protein